MRLNKGKDQSEVKDRGGPSKVESAQEKKAATAKKLIHDRGGEAGQTRRKAEPQGEKGRKGKGRTGGTFTDPVTTGGRKQGTITSEKGLCERGICRQRTLIVLGVPLGKSRPKASKWGDERKDVKKRTWRGEEGMETGSNGRNF